MRDVCALRRVTLAGVLGLDCFEEPFGAVRGEGTVGPVPDEQHVVPGEPELAVGVLGQRLVRGPAQGGSNRAGNDRRAGVVHEPLLRRWVQQGPERSHVNTGAGAAARIGLRDGLQAWAESPGGISGMSDRVLEPAMLGCWNRQTMCHS